MKMCQRAVINLCHELFTWQIWSPLFPQIRDNKQLEFVWTPWRLFVIQPLADVRTRFHALALILQHYSFYTATLDMHLGIFASWHQYNGMVTIRTGDLLNFGKSDYNCQCLNYLLLLPAFENHSHPWECLSEVQQILAYPRTNLQKFLHELLRTTEYQFFHFSFARRPICGAMRDYGAHYWVRLALANLI